MSQDNKPCSHRSLPEGMRPIPRFCYLPYSSFLCLFLLVAKLKYFCFKKNYKPVLVSTVATETSKTTQTQHCFHQFKMNGRTGSGKKEFSMNHKYLCWLSNWRQLIMNSKLFCCCNKPVILPYINKKLQAKLTHWQHETLHILSTLKQICTKVKQEVLEQLFCVSFPPPPSPILPPLTSGFQYTQSVENYYFYWEQSLSQMSPLE